MTKKEKEILSFFDFDRRRNFLRDFYDFDVSGLEKMLREKNEDFWVRLGEKRALKIFHQAAARVPAYKDFLRKNRVRPEKIKTIDDFKQIPLTDKKNYTQEYPLRARCWDGDLDDSKLVAMSSGTTGHPVFLPRGAFQEFEAAVTHELIYKYFFEIDKYRTLLVIGFPMGIYVSGVATLIPSILVSVKSYPVTIASVGNNKTDVLRVVEKIQTYYEQIILVGHPLFVKDVIETGVSCGLKWAERKLRMMFCSEEFSEKWRDYVIKKTGYKYFDSKSIISTYGSSEMLLMAHETPLSIKIRRAMEDDTSFRQKIIGEKSVPNFFQYNPFSRYIESVNEELVFTSASGVPLVRFNLHDRGRIFGFSQITSERGWRLPFAALWGRSDHKLVFYAANIYPEHIKAALSKSSFFPKLTGRFTLRKGYLKNMDEFLEINIESRKDVFCGVDFPSVIQKEVADNLKKINMEYLFLCNFLDKDLKPKIKLWPYQHEKYFKPGLKPKYILED